ncbi:MAG TPA: hypothetical protein VL154_10650 [Acetobacteraceae bacterium]|jgi:hypothetical protein|nr:hypothetical protein [Acetobacteraceae bacterium]
MTHFRRLTSWLAERARMSRAARLALAGLVLAVLPLAGCGPTGDTYDRIGTWHPQGVNDMNIAAQVADPHDLVRGRDIAQPNYRTSAAAVADLWSGKTTKAAAAAAAAGGGAGGAGGAAGGTP